MRDEVVTIRVSRIEKRKLTRAAKKEGCPLSDLVWWALRHELAGSGDKAPERLNQAGQ
jgi:hypothetical protein